MSAPLHIIATEEQLLAVCLRLLEAERDTEPQVDAVGPAEMCRRLSISRSTLHRMRAAGLPALKCGTEYRYEPGAVLEWLRARGAR